MRIPTLSRLRFRGRIVAAFLILLVIITALGAVGLVGLGVLTANMREITTNYMQATGHLSRMQTNQLAMRLLLRQVVMDGEHGQDIGALLRASDERQRGVEVQQKLYEPTVTAAEEVFIYAGFKDHWGRFLLAVAQVREAVAAKRFDAATTALNEGMLPAGNAADAALTQALNFNLAQGNKVAQDGAVAADFGRALIGGLLGVALLAAIGIGVWLVRSIATPVAALTGTMRRLADHDLAAEIPGAGRTDEVGDMAQAVQVFRDNMIRADELAAAQANEQTAKHARSETLDALIAGFETAAETLSGELGASASQLQATAQTLAANSSQAGAQAGIVAASAEEASAGVQTVAAATEELAASVGEIGRQVTQSAAIAGRAVADARQTDETVRALAEATQKIGDIVGLIQSIAGQTNLLACQEELLVFSSTLCEATRRATHRISIDLAT